MSAFIRGEGGFGGERGPSGPRNVAPDRAADAVIALSTRPFSFPLRGATGRGS